MAILSCGSGFLAAMLPILGAVVLGFFSILRK